MIPVWLCSSAAAASVALAAGELRRGSLSSAASPRPSENSAPRKESHRPSAARRSAKSLPNKELVRARYRSAWRPFARFNGIGVLLVCLGDLEIAVAKHGIAGRFRLVAGVPSFSSIPTAVARHGHRATLMSQLYGRVKPNSAQRLRPLMMRGRPLLSTGAKLRFRYKANRL